MSVTVNEASAVLRSAVRSSVRQRSWLYIFQGAVMALAGGLALLYPLIAGTGVVVMLGWVLVISALVQAVSLWGAAQVPYFWLQAISIVLELITGYLLISHPGVGLSAITMLMLILFLVGGVSRVIFALMLRPMRDWLWLLASGVVGIACASLLLLRLPEVSSWLIGLLLGIHLLSGGAAQGWLAWHLGEGDGA